MRCILHIGPPKTGSTSIQRFIRRNRADLDAAGFYLPKTRATNMREIRIAADADHDHRPDVAGKSDLTDSSG
ncbi:hypothetical protein [Roseovarius salinarum]|uniref:hypothetical protein n=1 Tax=Roseovarius salinarum TaxID=1981892 RepID=UPI0013000F45|nr:hypothetical protein [Roseovarius salinarum]